MKEVNANGIKKRETFFVKTTSTNMFRIQGAHGIQLARSLYIFATTPLGVKIIYI